MEDLAKELGVNRKTVYNALNCITHGPKARTVRELAAQRGAVHGMYIPSTLTNTPHARSSNKRTLERMKAKQNRKKYAERIKQLEKEIGKNDQDDI